MAWSELAQMVLDRLTPVDSIAARRFAANYVDDVGTLRFDQDTTDTGPSPQLGLPLDDRD